MRNTNTTAAATLNLNAVVTTAGRLGDVNAIRALVVPAVFKNTLLLAKWREQSKAWLLQVDVEIDANLMTAKRSRDGVVPVWYRSSQARLHAEHKAVELVSNILEAIAEDLSRPRAAIVKAAAPVTKTVIQAAPAPEYKPMPIQRKLKGIRKTAIARCEIRLNSFEELKELQENSETAAMDAEIASETAVA